jgi:hypothetical protein
VINVWQVFADVMRPRGRARGIQLMLDSTKCSRRTAVASHAVFRLADWIRWLFLGHGKRDEIQRFVDEGPR